MVDRFSFWLSFGNLFQGAKSIDMQFFVFGPKFEEEGTKASAFEWRIIDEYN